MSTQKKPARRPRIEEQKPVAVVKALRTYAETGDLQKTADTAGCHVTTIRRLLTRDTEGFALVKKELAKRAFELSAAAQERALEKVNCLSGFHAAVVAKMSAQSGLELQTGQPAGSVMVTLVQKLEQAREAWRLIQAADTDATDSNRTTTPEPPEP